MQTKSGKSPAYLYYFNRVPPGPGGERYGSYHASEISYVFGTMRRAEPIDVKLSDTMSSYWVNFATSGNPNGAGLPPWPAYDQKKDLAMGLGDKVAPIPVPNKPALDLFNELLDTARNQATNNK
jgi:para-nitrobenzyl esterase